MRNYKKYIIKKINIDPLFQNSTKAFFVINSERVIRIQYFMLRQIIFIDSLLN